MIIPSQVHTIEFLYREHFGYLVRFVQGRFPRFRREDAEDLVQDLFVRLQARRQEIDTDFAHASILGDCSVASLMQHLYWAGLSRTRREKSAKRGGRAIKVSLEAHFEETGYECESAPHDVTDFIECQKLMEWIFSVDEGEFSARERIILRILRKYLPCEISCVEILSELTGIERMRFLPARGACQENDVDQWILRAISRNKSSLQMKLGMARVRERRKTLKMAEASDV